LIVHSYYYGPKGNGLEITEGLKQLVTEEVIQELYTMDGSRNTTTQFDKVYQTRQGPVIGITRIEPVQSRDRRGYTMNRTIFVRYNDVIKDLSKLLDEKPVFPLRSLEVTLCKK
jgi:hypothetical protein